MNKEDELLEVSKKITNHYFDEDNGSLFPIKKYMELLRDAANRHEAEVMQGDSQPVFACAIDRDLFIKNAGTWMDVDTFCETVNERDEMRICNNCKYWDKTTMDCEEEDLFGCIELAQSPYNDGTFGCKKFVSKQTA